MSTFMATGELVDATTVKLDRPIGAKAGKVRLIIEAEDPDAGKSPLEVLEEIWAEQEAEGRIPPTAEEVEEYVRKESDSWGDR